MVKCMDCAHYKPLPEKEGLGNCFGAEVPGERDPKDSPMCKGEGFKPR